MGRHRNASPGERLSRKLSALLRHRAMENGLGDCLRPDGYVPLERVLALPGFSGVSAQQVRTVVAENDKQRFNLAYFDGAEHIRANQGHTLTGLDADALLTRLTAADVPAPAVHGTYKRAWGGIVASGGLSRMARNHVHLARGLPSGGGVISGMRASCEVAVWVDVAAAMNEGVPFFESANGVLLTPGEGADGILASRFFVAAIDLATGEDLMLGADT